MAQRIAHERNLHIEIKHCSKSILMRVETVGCKQIHGFSVVQDPGMSYPRMRVSICYRYLDSRLRGACPHVGGGMTIIS